MCSRQCIVRSAGAASKSDKFKPIVASMKSHQEFRPRFAPRFIVIYKTDGGFVAIIPVCFVTVDFGIKRTICVSSAPKFIDVIKICSVVNFLSYINVESFKSYRISNKTLHLIYRCHIITVCSYQYNAFAK